MGNNAQHSYSYVYENTPKRKMKRIIAYCGLLFVQGWIILTLAVFQKYLITVQASDEPVLTPVVLGQMTSSIAASPDPIQDVQFLPTPFEEAEIIPTATVVPTALPTVGPTVSAAKPKPPRDDYTIAVIGDSMVDTMGERLEYLEHALTARYPETKFSLYNYGIGSQNAEDILERFHEPLKYVDRDYPKIDDIKPDIIVVGCAPYNVFTPHFRDRHWLACTHLVQEAQKITSHVYMLAEIAPARYDFTSGPGGPNYDRDTAYTHSGHIIEQIQNVLGLSPVLNVPVIDAFTPSIANQEILEGKSEYINSHDHIHASILGHEFMAGLIADTITLP